MNWTKWHREWIWLMIPIQDDVELGMDGWLWKSNNIINFIKKYEVWDKEQWQPSK